MDYGTPISHGTSLIKKELFQINLSLISVKLIHVLFLISVVLFSACTSKKKIMKDPLCDAKTGICEPANLTDSLTIKDTTNSDLTVIYVGDPMCSWCWGISKELKKLKTYQETRGGEFELVLGGLRPGGGDDWDDEFKGFLKHHWEEVNERSGQPFGYDLFKRDSFNYDTEPSCRAVVVAREFIPEKKLEFFEAVQQRFYVLNEDPNDTEFYKPLCERFGIDYLEFKKKFLSLEAKQETNKDFILNRRWGVKGYPSILIKKENQMYLIANGYAKFNDLKERLEEIQLQNK